MFVLLSVLLFVTIVSAIPKGRGDIVYPTVETSRSGEKRIQFRALGRDIDLRLEPAGDIFSKDFGLYEGEEAREIPSTVNTLKNKLYKDRKNRAALYIDEGDFASIEGVIGEKVRIIPEETFRNGRRGHRVFEVKKRDEYGGIRHNDAIIPPGVKAPPEDLDVTATEIGRQKKNCIRIEILIVTEYYFSGSFSSNAEYEKYISITIVYSQTLIDTMNLNISLVSTGFLKYTKTSQPPFIEKSTMPNYPQYFDCIALIENMGNYYGGAKISKVNQADLVKLVTLRRMGDLERGKPVLNTLGIAYVAGVCDTYYKYGISVDDPNDFHEYINTFAHEAAHLIGCPHDEDPPVSYVPKSPGTMSCLWKHGYIMSYETNSMNGSKFSSCSADNAKHLFSLTEMTHCVIDICF